MVKVKSTKRIKAISSVQQFQSVDQMNSLTLEGNKNLADLEKKGKDVTIYLYSDTLKEQRLEAVGNLITITRGKNNSSTKTKVEVLKDNTKLDITAFNNYKEEVSVIISQLNKRIEELEKNQK